MPVQGQGSMPIRQDNTTGSASPKERRSAQSQAADAAGRLYRAELRQNGNHAPHNIGFGQLLLVGALGVVNRGDKAYRVILSNRARENAA